MNLQRYLILAATTAAAFVSTVGVAAERLPEPVVTDGRLLHPAKSPFPVLDLGVAQTGGDAAVATLGNRIGDVAAWYGKSADELRTLLRRDRMLRVDRRGRLFVEDELLAPFAEPVGAAAQSVQTGTLQPLDQTFLLHSKPGSQRTIYLNFRGATLSNTAWSAGTITAQAFDLDGVPGSFSTAELQRIQYIWQRVAEDFAPFDVNVTTEAPAAGALTRSSGTDQVFGTTVLITSSSGVYNCSCGGVAYLGVFDDTSDYYKPALVFYNQLGGGNEKYVAEAITHEAGHNMGLAHDGFSGGGYYSGHGSGATGWAPIMGVGYYRQLVQWSKGEYATANNVQDDFSVMASNGLPLRADDHGNTVGTATALTGAASGGNSVYTAQGIVERPSDVDVFAVGAAPGPLTVAVNPAARSPNLDVLVELRNASGTLLASANPPDALNATLTFTVAQAGTYYVTVQGVGLGDAAGTGYSDYGSLGHYALTVTAATPVNQAPTAVASATPTTGTVPLAVNFSSAGSSDPDGSIVRYEWTFGDGGTATGPTASRTYTTAGTYTAVLRVTDNLGLTATRNLTITANPAVTTPIVRVGDIAMTLSSTSLTAQVRAFATVTVRDRNGNLVPGARVNGSWSGIVSGSVNGITGSSGTVRLFSTGTRSRGTFVFTVTGIESSGSTYDASLNTETSDSITR